VQKPRINDRADNALREMNIERNYLRFAGGSALIKAGETHVICSATCEEGVPPFLKGSSKGWITAEYSMLPASSQKRIQRESKSGKLTGRTHEIQRLIGRSLRAIADTAALGERTITIDCDVVQADGGTRTASITGAYVALADVIAKLMASGAITKNPLIDSVAATSVGMVGGRALLDLDYFEDSTAEVDMNVVMTGSGKIIEIQGTAEAAPFSREDLNALITLATKGINELTALQMAVLSKQK